MVKIRTLPTKRSYAIRYQRTAHRDTGTFCHHRRIGVCAGNTGYKIQSRTCGCQVCHYRFRIYYDYLFVYRQSAAAFGRNRCSIFFTGGLHCYLSHRTGNDPEPRYFQIGQCKSQKHLHCSHRFPDDCRRRNADHAAVAALRIRCTPDSDCYTD